MKNGTSSAILVGDLLSGDGPFVLVADDFRRRRCSFCGSVDSDDMRFSPDDYLCVACWTPSTAG